MKVKALNKVPVLLDGEVVHLQPGQQYEVPPEVGEALLRGNDAVAVAKVGPAPVAAEPVAEPEPEPEPVLGKPNKRKTKNAGGAPLNKSAGKAPEDK